MQYDDFDIKSRDVRCLGLVLLTWIIFIPAWISNHVPNKVWDEIIHPFPNFKSFIAGV